MKLAQKMRDRRVQIYETPSMEPVRKKRRFVKSFIPGVVH